MSLSRVWPNGAASMPLSPSSTPMLAAADAAALDENLQQALDKSVAGDTIYSTVTVGAGAKIGLDSATSAVSAGASNVTTAAGGRAQCGHGDWPVFSSTQTLAHMANVMEQYSNLAAFAPAGLFPPNITLNWEWFCGAAGMTVGYPYGGNSTGQIPNSAAVVPATRMHDGALITAINVYFMVFPGRTGRPNRYPAINFWQLDPFLGQLTSLTSGWTHFGPASSLGAYCNGTVLGANISSGGSYGSPPSVAFSAAPAGGTTATGTAVLTAGAVTSITITDPGSGYAAAPTITFGSGTAAATAYLLGTPNPITATTNFTVDAGRFLYFLGILDEDYAAETPGTTLPNQWTGFGCTANANVLRDQ